MQPGGGEPMKVRCVCMCVLAGLALLITAERQATEIEVGGFCGVYRCFDYVNTGAFSRLEDLEVLKYGPFYRKNVFSSWRFEWMLFALRDQWLIKDHMAKGNENCVEFFGRDTDEWKTVTKVVCSRNRSSSSSCRCTYGKLAYVKDIAARKAAKAAKTTQAAMAK
eukprot:TRINITY_DN49344_c0_g1_i1.p1 TRINITY_DN49344_c0_g1~~TRINITY_DN49344_c0_g1_i1.p1  ORF type:complete len:165 (+),score=22.48 TRINITY_DN49344_c0_g1_i1:66-560(+)